MQELLSGRNILPILANLGHWQPFIQEKDVGEFLPSTQAYQLVLCYTDLVQAVILLRAPGCIFLSCLEKESIWILCLLHSFHLLLRDDPDSDLLFHSGEGESNFLNWLLTVGFPCIFLMTNEMKHLFFKKKKYVI